MDLHIYLCTVEYLFLLSWQIWKDTLWLIVRQSTKYSLLYVIRNYLMFSVAELLWRWGNLGWKPPMSDWEVVGSNPTAGMNRIGICIQGRNFNGFPWLKNVSDQFSTQHDHLVAYLWPICVIVVKVWQIGVFDVLLSNGKTRMYTFSVWRQGKQYPWPCYGDVVLNPLS